MTTTILDRRPTTTGRYRPRRGAVTGAGAVVLVVAAAGFPAVAGPYTVTVAATALVWALLAMSTQFLVGISGLPAFGQVGYFAIGAYTAALAGNAGFPNAGLQLVAATAVAGLAAAITGPLLLRARGNRFLMATFAVQTTIATGASQWTAVTGGDDGLHAPPVSLWPGTSSLTAPAAVYWYVLAVFSIIAWLLALLLRSRLVLALRGIAGHEPRMTALGYRVTANLTGGYTLAGALAGTAGALLGAVHQYVSPADAGFELASLMLLAAAIGAGTLTGAAAAAILIVVVRDLLGTAYQGLSPLLLGVLFLGVAYLPALRKVMRRQGWRPR